MMYVRYPLSLRNVEDLLHERGIDVTGNSTFRRSNKWDRIRPPGILTAVG
jgi:putative transposase